mmetsp:Transcript_154932/g.273680  ORF Transcript_154932/g.273680 Transcript_154932/m.273680 type:complete len:121 (-) Transcript_154932:757-1119(-)
MIGCMGLCVESSSLSLSSKKRALFKKGSNVQILLGPCSRRREEFTHRFLGRSIPQLLAGGQDQAKSQRRHIQTHRDFLSEIVGTALLAAHDSCNNFPVKIGANHPNVWFARSVHTHILGR